MLTSSGFTAKDLENYGGQLTDALKLLAPTTAPAAQNGSAPAPAAGKQPTAAVTKQPPAPNAPATATHELPNADTSINLEDLVSKEDPNRIYSEFKLIGSGAAGEVFLAFTPERKKVAVKKMALNSESTKLIITEIRIMKDSPHPNIVS
jgi:hypothetical protein